MTCCAPVWVEGAPETGELCCSVFDRLLLLERVNRCGGCGRVGMGGARWWRWLVGSRCGVVVGGVKMGGSSQSMAQSRTKRTSPRSLSGTIGCIVTSLSILRVPSAQFAMRAGVGRTGTTRRDARPPTTVRNSRACVLRVVYCCAMLAHSIKPSGIPPRSTSLRGQPPRVFAGTRNFFIVWCGGGRFCVALE